MGTKEAGEELEHLLRAWLVLSCASAEVLFWDGTASALGESDVLFWDLDREEAPPEVETGALFLCSVNPRKAIDSYVHHPLGFLQKPVQMNDLERAMDRCVGLWWPCLERVDLLCERVRMKLPLCQLLWVESGRRGCVLHSSMESLFVREPLSELEQRVPSEVFVRCQRSYLVNLNHVAKVGGTQITMSDGTEIPLGRGSKRTFLEAWKQFCALRTGLEQEDKTRSL